MNYRKISIILLSTMIGKSRFRTTLARDLAAIFFLLAVLLWFSGEMIWGGKVPFYRDLSLYFYPIGFSVAESFKNGELPLWNRHMAMGFPLLANFQSGAFYPPNLLYLFLPFFTAVRSLFFFHYAAAATGSYALGRHWSYPPFLALVGALVFTLGGTVVSLANLLNHFQTAVWLPWVILFSERALRSGSSRDVLAFVLALVFQFLAGSPEIYLMSLGLIFLNGLRIKWVEGSITYRRLVFLPVAACAAVLSLAMAQVLPTLELVLESRWREPMGYVETALYSLHPLSLVNLFFLDKFVSLEAGKGVHFFLLRDPPFLLSHYLGASALVGIALWLFYSSPKEKIFLFGVMAIFLALAMGTYTPVYPFLHRQLPFLGLFRFPEKFFFLVSPLLIFVALRGLSLHTSTESPSSKALAFAGLLTLLPLFGVYAFFRFDTSPLSRLITWASGTPLFTTATLSKTSIAMVYLERQLILTSGMVLLVFAWQKGKLRQGLFQALIVAVVLMDLGSAHRPYQFLLDPEPIYRSTKVFSNPGPEPYRLFYYPGPGNLHPSYYVLPREPGFAEFQSLIYSNLLPNAGVLYGVDYMQEIDAFRRWPYMAFLSVANRLPEEALYRLLGALNVGYVVGFRSLPGDGLNLVRHFPQYPSWLYKLNRAVPRVYVVPKASKEKNPLKTVSRLSDQDFDPLSEVILDRSLSINPARDFHSRASILRYGNHNVTVHASLNGPGILVLADAFYPGWRAYVDGGESTIYRANLFFRAVQLPPGEHLVEFKYRPLGFQVGLIISLATAGLLLLIVFRQLGRTRNLATGHTEGRG